MTRSPASRTLPCIVAAVLALTACGHHRDPPCAAGLVASASAPAACCPDGRVPAVSGECTAAGSCPAIGVSGDAPATTPGSFKGFADPALQADPNVPGRLWLAYSWPFIATGQTPTGEPVSMAAVASHLARSEDHGASFSFVGELYSAPVVLDPEGSGETGIASSETVSLAVLGSGGATTWYGAHLRYFLRPTTGYDPKYATSWTVRIGAAPSPDLLGDPAVLAKEVVVGVSTTATVYGATVKVDQLAGLPIQRCAMLNNPTLFARGGTLYLVVECLAFVGPQLDFAHSTMQVLATTPAGDPQTWSWRWVGTLADHSLAQELGNDTIQQPEVSEAADGTLLLVLTPAHADATVQVGTVGDGCVALELASIDPPALRRDCAGHAVVRARLAGTAMGSCAHDPSSVTGLVPTRQQSGAQWMLYASGIRP
jgi:hypothetical protein